MALTSTRRTLIATSALAAAVGSGSILTSALPEPASALSRSFVDRNVTSAGSELAHPTYPGILDPTVPPYRVGTNPVLAGQIGFRYLRGLDTDPTWIGQVEASSTKQFIGLNVVSPAEAAIVQQEDAIQSALAANQSAIADRVGSSFAGVFVDQMQHGVIYIYATSPVDASDFADLFPPDTQILTYVVPNSLESLSNTLSAVQRDTSQLAAAGVNITQTGIDVRNNDVAIGVNSAVPTSSLAKYGPVVEVVQPAQVPLANYTRDTYPPMQGGMDLETTFPNNAESYCSTGFNVTMSGHDYEVTASHCSMYNNGYSVYANHGDTAQFLSNIIGATAPNPYQGPFADVELDRISATHATENVWLTTTKSFTLKNAPDNPVPIGTVVQFSGDGDNNGNHPSNNGNTSGVVNSNTYGSGLGFLSQAEVSMMQDVCSGDSGGTFYDGTNAANAWGILSAGDGADGGSNCSLNIAFTQWYQIRTEENVVYGYDLVFGH